MCKSPVYFAFLLQLLMAGTTLPAQTSSPTNAVVPPVGLVVNVRDLGAKGDGVTDDAAVIDEAILQAKKAGPGSSVYFPAGHYLLDSHTVVINGADGLTVYGDGPTTVLLAKKGGTDIVTLRGCKHVTVRKLVLDRSEYSFTQGTVDSVNLENKTCSVTLAPGYPSLDAPALAGTVVFRPFTYPDSGTYQQNRYIPALTAREQTGPQQWLLHLSGDVEDDWTGKSFFIWASSRGEGIVAVDDADCLLEDIAYYGRGANAGFYIKNTEGTMTFRRCVIDVPPGSPDLLSCGGGGQFCYVRGKLIFDHCKFMKIDDDGADILTTYVRILQQPSPQELLLQSDDSFRVGDTLAVMNWPLKTESGTAVITQLEQKADKSCLVTLDHPVTVGKTGPGTGSLVGRPQVADGVDRVVDYNDVTTSTEFHECEFQDLRARPLNLKAQNCLVEGCTFHDGEMPAIAAGPEFYWEEAPAVHHLTIRNCTFTNCDTSNIDVDYFNADKALNGGVECTSYDNQDILIEGNTFTHYGAYPTVYPYQVGCAIHVRYATNVVIRHNIFGAPAPTAPAGVPKLLIQHSKNVIVQDNEGLPAEAVKQE